MERAQRIAIVGVESIGGGCRDAVVAAPGNPAAAAAQGGHLRAMRTGGLRATRTPVDTGRGREPDRDAVRGARPRRAVPAPALCTVPRLLAAKPGTGVAR